MKKLILDNSHNSKSRGRGNSDNSLDIIFEDLLREGRNTFFEDGIENGISRKVHTYIVLFREYFLDFIWKKVFIEDNLETISNILHYIGQCNYNILKEERRNLLEYYLIHSKSARIRDGASLGLNLINDPKSIPCIRLAIAKESVKTLQEWYYQILNELVINKELQKGENFEKKTR